MSSTRERAWLAAHQKGSKALIQKLEKAHANNPEYQAFKKKHGLGDTSSVKQVSKSTVDKAKEKARQTLAAKAYGATKGTRMGSAEGTGETLRDTIAPLTRDQHSAVKAAEKAAKPSAAPKPAKPKKEKAAAPAPEKKKPSALELIAAAAAKRKINQPPVSAKALRRIAAVGDMDHDHGGFDDLSDTEYGGRGNRSIDEEVELDEVDKHSFLGKILRKHELKKKVDSTFKDIGDAQRRGNHSAASKAFRKHERYANLERPGTWTKVKEEVELDEGMLDDYIEGKIAKHHANKHNPEINAAHADAAEVTKKINPFKKKIAQIKKRVSYKNKTHPNYAKTRADLKDAAAAIQPLDAERSKHYDRIRDARNKRDSNTDSDVDTYHKWGIVGLGVKKLKQKLTKEEIEQVDEASETEYSPHAHSGYSRAIKPGTKIGIHQRPRGGKLGLGKINPAEVTEYHGQDERGQHMYTVKQGNKTRNITSRSALIRTIKKPSVTKEEVEQIDEMRYGIGTVVKLKNPIDGHSYATVKGFTSSGSTRGPTGRGVPMPAGKVKKVKVALRKSDDHSYYAGPITHIEHGDVHSVIRESAPGWMLKQDPKLAKKVEAKKKLAKKRQEQMGNQTPIQEAKHHMGGALFADTAARLQKAIDAHKQRMDQITSGPEDEYHHPTLNIKTKSRVKLPAPWAKVEDK